MWGRRVQITYTTVTKEHGPLEQGLSAARSSVISLSSRSLFPLTATGIFLDMHYDRLNIVRVESAARAK